MPNKKLEHINYNGETYDLGVTDLATTSTPGLMSASDKEKLDGIADGSGAVTIANTTTEGVRIATIGINGTDYDIYAPEDTNTTYTLTTTGSGNAVTSVTLTGTEITVAKEATYNNYIHPSYTSQELGLYKVATDTLGHVSSTSAVTKSDITSLGIPSENTTYTFTESGSGNAVSGWTVSGTTITLNKDATYNNYSHPTYTSQESNLYKITVDNTGHVSATTAVTKSDLTDMGLPSENTTYTLTKSGDNLILTPSSGSANTVTLNAATTTENGLLTASDKTKLDGISEGAKNVGFTQTVTSGTTIGIITIDGTDTNIYTPTYTGSGVINVTGTTISHNTSGVTASTYGTTASTSTTLDFGDSFVIPGFSVDSTGHVTAAGSHEVGLPSLLITPTRTDGEKIASISVNGVDADLYATAVTDSYSSTSTVAMSGVAVASALGELHYAGSPTTGGIANKTMAIPFGVVDGTSTNKAFTASVDGITELTDGVCVLLQNSVVTSTSGFTININNLGAKPCYNNMATGYGTTDPTRDTSIFNINYTMLFVYSSSIVSGGGWICYRGYNSDTNTIAYQVRTNNTQFAVTDTTYRYRLLFTSATGTQWVPSNYSTSTNSTSARVVNQRPIDPFGRIVYYSYTATFSAGGKPGTSYLWDKYNITLGYSFNRAGAALTLTTGKPVYVKCAPQSDGSAIIDADNPYVQDLPNTKDGKIYILLGVASAATSVELSLAHPVYYYKDNAIRIWTNAADPDLADVAYSGLYNDLIDKPTIPDATNVTYTATTTAGDQIGVITIDGVDNELYSPAYTSTGAITVSNRQFAHTTSGANTTVGETAAKTLDFGDTFSVLRATVDNYGHTTSLTGYQMKIPTASAVATYTAGTNIGRITLNGTDTEYYIPAYPTASTLGLSSALKFIGFATSAMSDGDTTTPTVSGLSGYTPAIGDVVIDSSSHYEYVYTSASKWEKLGGDGSYVVSGVDYDVTNTGTNAPSAVTISAQTTSVYSMTSTGSVEPGAEAVFTMTVSNEKLTFTFEPNTPTTVSLPGRSTAINAWTGYNTGVNNTYAAAQTFSPTTKTITI